MLNWSRQSLASAAQVAARTVVDFERGARRPFDRTLRDIRGALEEGGVIFIDQNEEGGPGVRLKNPI
jgi:transcriptional regulator with XRE-family HTH domain